VWEGFAGQWVGGRGWEFWAGFSSGEVLDVCILKADWMLFVS
jgi:hypothetical protein